MGLTGNIGIEASLCILDRSRLSLHPEALLRVSHPKPIQKFQAGKFHCFAKNQRG
jgi:hypothetical protein